MNLNIQGLINDNPDYFKGYHSVEIDLHRYEDCVNKFKKHDNVHIYLGDSGDKIPEIINQYKNERFVCWLDAHYMNDDSVRGYIDCPILKELSQLKSLNKPPIIFIDDMFYMLNRDDLLYESPDFNSHHWPVYDDIKKHLEDIDKNYKITLSLIKGQEDLLVAIPSI